MSPRRVLVADDTEDMRVLLRTVFRSAGFEVVGEAADGAEALQMWREREHDCVVVLDQRMPRMTGIEAAEAILAEAADTVVVLFSAYLKPELVEQARQIGIVACVAKDDVLTITRLPAVAAVS